MAGNVDVTVNVFDLRLVLAALRDDCMRDEPSVRNAEERVATAMADVLGPIIARQEYDEEGM